MWTMKTDQTAKMCRLISISIGRMSEGTIKRRANHTYLMVYVMFIFSLFSDILSMWVLI